MADGSIFRLPHDTATDLNGNTPLQRELVYDTTNDEVRYGDGATAGGIVLAKKAVMESLNTSQSILISTADSKASSAAGGSNDSVARSMATSAASTADSQNTSQSTLISTATTNAATADSKALSVSTVVSTNLATTGSQNTSQSTLISTATTNAATADSKALSVSTLTSTADSKATSAAALWTLTAAPGSDHTASGIKIQLAAHQDQGFGDLCYIASDGQAQLVDADAIATTCGIVLCADASISTDATGNYLLYGVARDDTWNWTVGGLIYATVTGTTGNTLSQSAPSGADDVIQVVGVATHADRMIFFGNLVQVEHT